MEDVAAEREVEVFCRPGLDTSRLQRGKREDCYWDGGYCEE
jgi:hypothetical protein